MKHRKLIAVLVLALGGAALVGCSCVSKTAEEGESMMNDLESNLMDSDSSQGILFDDSSRQDSHSQNSSGQNSKLDNSNLTGPNSGGAANNSSGSHQSDINASAGNESSVPSTVEQRISEDEALDIALREAGASRESVSNLSIHLEYDDDTADPYYEIEFFVDNTQYEFEVSALDGAITKLDTDRS